MTASPADSSAPSIPLEAQHTQPPAAWLLWNLALMIFVSAFLLFQVQPLISKFILPWFGGAPAVWTTCMLFFQTLLLGGYAYAHFTTSWLTPKQQAILHLVLLAAAAATLPIVPHETWKPTDGSDPTWRILGLLTCTVGLPYFVLSSTGPLGQAWFSRAFVGSSPYRLYALSNVGSLLALVSYPFLVEPRMTDALQAWSWSGGFGLFIALCGASAIWIWRQRGEKSPPAPTESDAKPQAALAAEADHVSVGRRALWLLLPACGSLMLLATTNHCCQDVAVVPFLWVVPLALYLLTFIICFDHQRWYRRGPFCLAAAILVFLAADGADKILDGLSNLLPRMFSSLDPQHFELSLNFIEELALLFAAMFVVCMICHGELVRLRPAPRHLTEYYLLISAGGALGGIFVSLIAPHVFKSFLEWNIGLVVSFALAGIVWLEALGWLGRPADRVAGDPAPTSSSGFRQAGRMLSIPGLAVGLILVVLWQIQDATPRSNTVFRTRNFYGLVSVRDVTDVDDPTLHFHELRNGRIKHGRQFVSPDPVRRRQLTTYYGEQTGAGRAIRYFQSQPEMHVGVVGLGAGTIAAYATQPGHRITFYEINPVVIDVAQNPSYFTFLSECRGKIDIVPGDARLSLVRQPPQKFDVLVLDAFSGDAPPAHLLTHEAFAAYERHMQPDGIIAVHITNRYVNLAPVVQAAADAFHYGVTRICTDDDDDRLLYHTDYMLLTHNDKFLAANPSVLRKGMSPTIAPVEWTDHYSNLFQLLMFK